MTTSSVRFLTLVVAVVSLCGTARATNVGLPLPVQPTGNPSSPYIFYEPEAWAEDTFSLLPSTQYPNGRPATLNGSLPEIHTQSNSYIPVPIWAASPNLQIVQDPTGATGDGIVVVSTVNSSAPNPAVGYVPSKYNYDGNEEPSIPVISVQAAIRPGNDTVSIGMLETKSSGSAAPTFENAGAMWMTLDGQGDWTLQLRDGTATDTIDSGTITSLNGPNDTTVPFSKSNYYSLRLEWNVLTNSAAAFITNGTWRYDPSNDWVFTGVDPTDGSDTENLVPNIPLSIDFPDYNAYGFQFHGPDAFDNPNDYDSEGNYIGASLDNFAAVSEPNSVGLLGFGAVGLTFYGLSRRKNRRPPNTTS